MAWGLECLWVWGVYLDHGTLEVIPEVALLLPLQLL